MRELRRMIIKAEPLHADAFAAFGAVFDAPAPSQRIYLDQSLANRRPVAAKASFSLVHVAPRTERPLPLAVVERHAFSSQSFTPLGAGRYLVVAAPQNAEGGADLAGMRAFVGRDFQSFTYAADVWHGPITPLDDAMRFAIMMFNDGASGDEEVVRHDAPFAAVAFDD
jgi:ureidoglycolate lyase